MSSLIMMAHGNLFLQGKELGRLVEAEILDESKLTSFVE